LAGVASVANGDVGVGGSCGFVDAVDGDDNVATRCRVRETVALARRQRSEKKRPFVSEARVTSVVGMDSHLRVCVNCNCV
jgi:hypothetical protein